MLCSAGRTSRKVVLASLCVWSSSWSWCSPKAETHYLFLVAILSRDSSTLWKQCQGRGVGLGIVQFPETRISNSCVLMCGKSCLTSGSDTCMPVGELAFEVLFCIKHREQSEDYTLETLRTAFEETFHGSRLLL